MKIQVTATKTVEWDPLALFRRKGGGAVREVTGVEIGSGDPRGCPAVRLVRAGGGYRLKAFGFVPAPVFGKPWSLPSEFRAPSAAIAVNDASAYSRQTAVEAGEKSAVGPQVVDGSRTVSVAFDSETRLAVGLREETAEAVAKLLPEGARPTAVSIQIAQMAVLAALPAMADFRSGDDAQLALIVGEEMVRAVGFRKGVLALLRTCSDTVGSRALRRSVCESLGLDAQTCDEMLDAGVVSPGEGYGEMIRPFLRQLGISREYLLRGVDNGKVGAARIFGLRSGVAHWNSLAQTEVGLSLTTASVFDGLRVDGRVAAAVKQLSPGDSQVYLAALGAAIAALEDPSSPHPMHVNLLRAEERVNSSPIRKRVILPIVSCLFCLSMLGWWALQSASLALVAAERNESESVRNGLREQHAAAVADRAQVEELRGHIAELRSFVGGRHAYGGLLAHIAETVPDDLQIRSLVIAPARAPVAPPPPGQLPAPPQIAAAESPTVRIIGLAPRENTVVNFMQDLGDRDGTGELVVDRGADNPELKSPRVHSFRQYDGGNAGGRGRPAGFGERRRGVAQRLLSFDIEFRLKERRFAK